MLPLFLIFALAQDTMENDSNAIDLPGIVVPAPELPFIELPTTTPATTTNPTASSSDTTPISPTASTGGTASSTPSPLAPFVSPVGDVVVTTGVASGAAGGTQATNAVVQTLLTSNAISISSSGGVTVSSGLVRDTFVKEGVHVVVVRGWDPITKRFVVLGKNLPSGSLALTAEDLAVIAASESLSDSHIVSATLIGANLSLTYRTSGRLFSLIPFTFPVTIYMNTSSLTRSGRVELVYPWYRFFIWRTVPPDELITAIDAAMTAAAEEAVDERDAQARLFLRATEALRSVHNKNETGIRLVL